MKIIPKGDGFKCGFIDEDGNYVIEPKFEETDMPFSDGVANVCLSEKQGWGYIDINGDWVIKPQFLEADKFCNGIANILANEDEIRGFIDRHGNYLFKPKAEFDYGVNCESRFIDGVAMVCNADSELWGGINTEGDYVIPAIFNEARQFAEGVAAVKVKECCGYIDNNGNWRIEPTFEEAKSFYEGLAAVKTGGKWGYITSDGKLAIDAVYDDAENFTDGVAIVKSGENYGVIRKDGSTLVAFDYESIERSRGGFIVEKGGKYGYLSFDIAIVIEPRYDYMGEFCNDRVCVAVGNKYGYIDREGKIVVEPCFDYGEYSDFSDGAACVQINDKYGYIDINGNWIVDPVYSEANAFCNGLARVAIDEDGTDEDGSPKRQVGYIDLKGRLIGGRMFDCAGYFYQNRLAVKADGKWGYIDRKGNWIVKATYDDASDFFNGIAQVKRGEDTGYIDVNGRLVRKMLDWFGHKSDAFDKRFYGLCPCWKNDKASDVKNGLDKYDSSASLTSVFDDMDDCEVHHKRYDTQAESLPFGNFLKSMQPEEVDLDASTLREFALSRFSSLARLSPDQSSSASTAHTLGVKFTLDIDSDALTLTAEGHLDKAIEEGGYEGALIKEMRSCNEGGSFFNNWGSSDDCVSVDIVNFPSLANMLHGIAIIATPDGRPVKFSNEQASLELHLVRKSDDKNTIVPQLRLFAGGELLDSPRIISEDTAIVGTTFYTFAEIGANYNSIGSLIQKFPEHMVEHYLSLFLTYFRNITPVYNDHKAIFSKTAIIPRPTLVLERVANDGALYMRLTQSVDGEEPFSGSGLASLTLRAMFNEDRSHIVVYPIPGIDLAEYRETLKGLIDDSVSSAKYAKEIYIENDFYIIGNNVATTFIYKHLPQLLQLFRVLGAKKLGAYKVTPSRPKLEILFSSGIDYLEGEATVSVGGDKFYLNDFLRQWKKDRYIELSDGNRAIVEEKYIQSLQRIFHLSNNNAKGTEHVIVSMFDLPELYSILNDDEKAKLGVVAERFRNILRGFNDLQQSELGKLPVNATLRPYQTDGVKWIKYLYDNRIGGCLADDMGLGKTLQTISVLAMVCPDNKRPNLVIMPRSLLFNWQNELQRFAPELTVSTYYGPDRNLKMALESQIVLTTYAMVRNDIEELEKVEFNYVILDESQNIKNVKAQTSQAVTRIKAERRLALSGTPVENNLTEIYSLFNFLNPSMFGTLDEFANLYINGQGVPGNDVDAISALRRKIYPFILRREKSDVLTDLPERIDQTIYVDMTPQQAAFYEQKRSAYKEIVGKAIKQDGVGKSKFMLLQAMNELRQIASVPENLTDGSIKSSKIEQLGDMIISSVVNGHKTVVFFNYLTGVELIGEMLEAAGISHGVMTGSTSAAERKNLVNRFQSDPSFKVLLLTLKVGGVGLNLTAADTVFLAEPWWNKAAENQAIDRLHRFGQKHTVNAYSLITRGTIEEKIALLQQQKQYLFDSLLNSDLSSSKNLSEDDINLILS